jgi:photosystem II stability/assembly factor-like uncharacterized protein
MTSSIQRTARRMEMTRIYVGTSSGLLILNEEDPQSTSSIFEGSAVETAVLDRANPGRIYVGFYSGQEMRGQPDLRTANGLRGVWRSDDGGQSWQDCTDGLAQSAITSLAVRGGRGSYGTVYAGMEPSALSVSHDGGGSWQPAGDLIALPSSSTWAFPPRPYTHHVRWIEIDPVESAHLYLCIEAGALIQSRDGGATWIDRVPDAPFDTHTLATHRLAPGRLYAAAGDGFMQAGDGYAESDDRGATWRRFGDGLDHHYLYGLAVDSGDPDTVLISAASSPFAAHDPGNAESYVYRREAGGPWQPAMKGLPDASGMTASILAAHPERANHFYAASNQGLFQSQDAGRNWERIPITWEAPLRARNARALAVEG